MKIIQKGRVLGKMDMSKKACVSKVLRCPLCRTLMLVESVDDVWASLRHPTDCLVSCPNCVREITVVFDGELNMALFDETPSKGGVG